MGRSPARAEAAQSRACDAAPGEKPRARRVLPRGPTGKGPGAGARGSIGDRARGGPPGAQTLSAPCRSCGLRGTRADPGAQWPLRVPIACPRRHLQKVTLVTLSVKLTSGQHRGPVPGGHDRGVRVYPGLKRGAARGARPQAPNRKPWLSLVGAGQWSQSRSAAMETGRAASAAAVTSRRLPPFPVLSQRGTTEGAGSAPCPRAERWPCTTTTRGRARPTSMLRYQLGRLAATPTPELCRAALGPRHARTLGRCTRVLSPGTVTADEGPARGPPSELRPVTVLCLT